LFASYKLFIKLHIAVFSSAVKFLQDCEGGADAGGSGQGSVRISTGHVGGGGHLLEKRLPIVYLQFNNI
jgi:hypothetical protein